MTQDVDPLVRPTVAAKRLGVCPETIWRWMRKGVMAYEEVGPYRKKRIRESVLQSLVTRASVEATDVPHGT